MAATATTLALTLCTALFLAGCGAIKVPMEPNIGKVPVKNTLAVKAALLITKETTSYRYVGKAQGEVPGGQPFEYPLGKALEKASIDAFSQVFADVVLVRTGAEAKKYKITIEPEIKEFSFSLLKKPFASFALSSIKVNVALYSAETRVWKKTVESPEQKKIIDNSGFSDYGESASAALVYALKEVAEDISTNLLGIFGFFRIWKNYREMKPIMFSAAICLTVLITPHAMIYDWVLLLIPAVLLWEYKPNLRQFLVAIYALIWIVTIISGSLTNLQLGWFSRAVQISVPVYLYLLVTTNKFIFHPDPIPDEI